MPFASVASSYTDLVTTVFSTPIEAKAWFATAAIVLALVQITTAARIYGRLRGSLSTRAPGLAAAAIAGVRALGGGAA